MNVFVPWVQFFPATQLALIEYNVTFVRLAQGEWDPHDVGEQRNYSYQEYWAQRWNERRPFINVEQDVVPWAGALEELWDCPEPWCAFNYHLKCHRVPMMLPNGYPPLGCVKISAELIAQTPLLWDGMVMWDHCDTHLADGLRRAGHDVHPHYPGVVNANPALLRTAERI